jgi:hypothetical protein
MPDRCVLSHCLSHLNDIAVLISLLGPKHDLFIHNLSLDHYLVALDKTEGILDLLRSRSNPWLLELHRPIKSLRALLGSIDNALSICASDPQMVNLRLF